MLQLRLQLDIHLILGVLNESNYWLQEDLWVRVYMITLWSGYLGMIKIIYIILFIMHILLIMHIIIIICIIVFLISL